MSKPRTPRDHDRAIAALRKQALELRNETCEPIAGSGNRDLYRRQDNMALHEAAAYSVAADYLASIRGTEERAHAKAKASGRTKR